MIPKGDGGLRPLATAVLAWRLGAACLVQLLGDWIRRVFPEELYGGMPGRSVDDVRDVKKCFDSASPFLANAVAPAGLPRFATGVSPEPAVPQRHDGRLDQDGAARGHGRQAGHFH